MADATAIARLRLLINEPDATNGYTDQALGDRLDVGGGEDLVAYQIWTEKAAKFAELVDISEGGSSRKMGDLHEQALNMATVFSQRVNGDAAPTRTRISKLRR